MTDLQARANECGWRAFLQALTEVRGCAPDDVTWILRYTKCMELTKLLRYAKCMELTKLIKLVCRPSL